MTVSVEKLRDLYQEMYELTRPKCDECRSPRSCCKGATMYCEMAIETARDKFGVELERTGNEDAPLLGENGCTAAPHFRPLCTLHVCGLSALGCFPKDPEWFDRYMKLREEISLAETDWRQEHPEGDGK